jgi:hypothetical protein
MMLVGGGCIGAWRNSRTIPTVQNNLKPKVQEFFVPVWTQIGVFLLTNNMSEPK